MKREIHKDFIDWPKFKTTDEYRRGVIASLAGILLANEEITEDQLTEWTRNVQTLKQARKFFETYGIKSDFDEAVSEIESGWSDTEKFVALIQQRIRKKFGFPTLDKKIQ